MSRSGRNVSLVFIGDIDGIWKSGAQRLAAADEAGATILGTLDYGQLPRAGRWSGHAARLLGQPALPATLAAFNRDLLARCRELPTPEVAWIEWPRWIFPATLRALREIWPGVRLVCFQDDNPFGDRREDGAWSLFRAGIPEFDLHFVKRDSDLAAFRVAGARRVEKFLGGYSAALLSAGTPSPHQDLDVTFIGTAMDDRPARLRRLREEFGVSVHAFGGKWDRSSYGRAYPELVHPHANGAAYVETITRSKICLGFVSRSNRDGYTMRSFEIPALGGFLLAARTPEHRALYREGVEAEFFDGVEECAKVIHRYLEDESARGRVAAAGQVRCMSDYSLVNSMQAGLEIA